MSINTEPAGSADTARGVPRQQLLVQVRDLIVPPFLCDAVDVVLMSAMHYWLAQKPCCGRDHDPSAHSIALCVPRATAPLSISRALDAPQRARSAPLSVLWHAGSLRLSFDTFVGMVVWS